MTRNPAQRKNWRPRYLAGAELERRRKEAGLTQAALADLVGSSQDNVAHWEKDDYGPDIEKVVALARALDCKPTDLMHEDGRGLYFRLVEALGGKAA